MVASSYAANAYNAAQGINVKDAGKGTNKVAMGLGLETTQAPKPNFSGLVDQAIKTVVSSGAQADAQMTAAARGEANLVNVVTAVTKAETLIQTMSEIRNRAIAAYEEVLRMQV
jgi:flagellar hook-basal body complex protein FliE